MAYVGGAIDVPLCSRWPPFFIIRIDARLESFGISDNALILHAYDQFVGTRQ